MKYWNVLLTAVFSGAALGAADAITKGDHNWQHIGTIAAFGAIVGLANLYRTPPGK